MLLKTGPHAIFHVFRVCQKELELYAPQVGSGWRLASCTAGCTVTRTRAPMLIRAPAYDLESVSSSQVDLSVNSQLVVSGDRLHSSHAQSNASQTLCDKEHERKYKASWGHASGASVRTAVRSLPGAQSQPTGKGGLRSLQRDDKNRLFLQIKWTHREYLQKSLGPEWRQRGLGGMRIS